MKKVLFLFVFFLIVSSFSAVRAEMPALKKPPDSNKIDTSHSKVASVTESNKTIVKTETVTVVNTTDCKQCKTKHNRGIAFGVILLIIILFVFLVFYSNILRDFVDADTFLAKAKTFPKYKDYTDVSKIPRPFSLSRTQLGLWTVIIACSYIYLSSKCCWQVIEFTTNILALMGISSGAAAIGNAIDKNQSSGTAATERHQNQSPSEGFLTDILSDENGISIHRFQNVVFTFVGIIIFLFQVYNQCNCGKFPELDMTLIALMGISTATYLGIKINENKS